MANGKFRLNAGGPLRRGILVAGSRILKLFVKAFNDRYKAGVVLKGKPLIFQWLTCFGRRYYMDCIKNFVETMLANSSLRLASAVAWISLAG